MDPTNNASSDVHTSYGPDAYEPDDYRSEARPIATDGTVQHHNFDIRNDLDWVWFTPTLGKEYVIETSSLGATADTYLTLHNRVALRLRTTTAAGAARPESCGSPIKAAPATSR